MLYKLPKEVSKLFAEHTVTINSPAIQLNIKQ